MSTASSRIVQADDASSEIATLYAQVRGETLRLTEPLAPEDMVVQSMPDVSPTKWHLAHMTWFFETFLLKEQSPGYEEFQDGFEYLFNSYYNAVGRQYPRPRRGLITRPDVEETLEYRRHVDEHMLKLLNDGIDDAVLDLVMLGLNHEQQHQELLLMDIKHVLFQNPLYPAYRPSRGISRNGVAPLLEWVGFEAGMRDIGFDGEGFAFDNESPRHPEWVDSFELASRPVTNGDYLQFVADGGYERPELWLSDGWTTVQKEAWCSPLYWVRRNNEWLDFTLGGVRALDLDAPVSHVSLFEADAYATWADARLPTEAEWETAAATAALDGHFLDSNRCHPEPARGDGRLRQLFGDVWEWTQSAYAPYPGFRPARGALGEYNGKFMCNQYVMRGGCCVTPAGHMRLSYRNFFYPHMRWQFGGIRLAR